jgi:hypothetical protein
MRVADYGEVSRIARGSTSRFNWVWNRIAWQKDRKDRPRFAGYGPGFESNTSPVSFDDGLGYPQTQSCSNILVGGKEWLEQLRAMFSVDAAARIRDKRAHGRCDRTRDQ